MRTSAKARCALEVGPSKDSYNMPSLYFWKRPGLSSLKTEIAMSQEYACLDSTALTKRSRSYTQTKECIALHSWQLPCISTDHPKTSRDVGTMTRCFNRRPRTFNTAGLIFKCVDDVLTLSNPGPVGAFTRITLDIFCDANLTSENITSERKWQKPFIMVALLHEAPTLRVYVRNTNWRSHNV